MNHTIRRRTTPVSRAFSQIGLLIALFLISTQVYAAKDPIYTSLLSNKAAGGYDVVSYFQGDGVPTKGQKEFKIVYKGADWLFSSQQNMDTFEQEPEKYAPQYGGYCAYALASNETVKGDPLEYHIFEDKLYLNINAKYKKIWVDDKLNYIDKGDANWPTALN